MLTGAFAAAVFATFSGSAWVGLLAGVVATVVVSLIHGYASIDQRANQIVSGTAINLVADGMTALIGNAIWSQGGRTPQLPDSALFHTITLPFVREIGAVPFVGSIYRNLISGHDIVTYFAFLLAPLTYWALYSTRFGLRLRAVGENPAAVDTAGISVRGLRYLAVIICGVLVGLSGVYLSLSQAGYFQPHMSAGKGFIALAALVFAKWRPWPALATCLLFGFLDALSFRMQGAVVPGIGEVPVQAIQALPYILTVVLLAGFIGKAIPPKASGVPYVKER
jgi:simple sugar transport system permease protein